MQIFEIKLIFILILSTGFFVACNQNRDHMPLADIHSGAGTQSNAVGGPYYKTDILPLVQKNCVACHGPGSGHDWTDYDTFRSKKDQIEVRVLGANANMPLGTKLSDADKSLLRAWITAGMPYAPADASNPTQPPVVTPTPNPMPGPPPIFPAPAQVLSCVGCHGDMGNSTNSLFPKLAGQTQMYLAKQLKDFQDKARADDDAQSFMWPVVPNLSADDINIISAYFSSQIPVVNQDPRGDLAKIAAGKNIYDNGIPDKGIPACLSCHGAQGQGLQNFPRLAGQHSIYISKQLNYFKSGKRANDSTMPAFTKLMSDDNIEDISEFVNSL